VRTPQQVKCLKGVSAITPRTTSTGDQDLRLIYPKSRADYPGVVTERLSAQMAGTKSWLGALCWIGSSAARSERLARSLSSDSAMMSEFNDLFTDTFMYGSIAVLAAYVFAAMWIIRR
jgi:hypothetical protein